MDTKILLSIVFLCVACVLGGCVSSGKNMPGVPLEIIVRNQPGLAIAEIYCSPAFSSLSLAELLGDSPLEDGQRRSLWFEAEIPSAYWDILAVDVYGNEYSVNGISVKKTPVIVLSAADDESDISDFYDFDSFDDFSLDTL